MSWRSRTAWTLPQAVAVLIAAYSAAFYSDRRLVVAALLLVASASALALGGTVRIPNGLIPLVLVAPVWLGASAMRRREQQADASAERADRLEREREAALRAERARIARELHDVVTHSVSVMVLQTGAAQEIMSRDERRSRELLESVQSSGRSALEELRHMLGLLSDQDGRRASGATAGRGRDPSTDRAGPTGRRGHRAARRGAATSRFRRSRRRGLPNRPGSPHKRDQACRRRANASRPALIRPRDRARDPRPRIAEQRRRAQRSTRPRRRRDAASGPRCTAARSMRIPRRISGYLVHARIPLEPGGA